MNALLALFVRSLRQLLRSTLSYWTLSATVGLIFLFLLGASATATATSAPGLRFFQNSLFIVLSFITLAGVSYFASAITEEKEEGTLGLLRMTDLDPLAILFGKGTSRLGGALLLLAATMPFTFLAVTLGGISARQVVASYLCLGAYLILLANLALCVSVISARGAIASAIMTAIVLGAAGLATLLKAVPGWISKLPYADAAAFIGPAFTSVANVIETVNPFRRLGAILTTGWGGSVVGPQFWWSLGLSAGFLALGWLLFDVATGDGGQTPVPRLVPKRNERDRTIWQRFVPGRAWMVSALAWKDYYFVYGGRLVSYVKWVAYGLLCGALVYAQFGSSAVIGPAGAAMFWTMSCILAIEVLLVGSRIIRGELREQTLTGLAGLPLAMQHIILMKLNGARRSLVPAFTWMCIGGGMLFADAVAGSFAFGRSQSAWISTALGWGYLASQVWLLAHLTAYYSLKLKWGALPVSLAIVFAANLVGLVFCIGIFVMPIVALTYVPHLRNSIYRRLEELAGEEG